MLCRITYKWVKSFKNGPSEIFGRQTLKHLVCIADHITSNWKVVFHKCNLVHSWIPWPKTFCLLICLWRVRIIAKSSSQSTSIMCPWNNYASSVQLIDMTYNLVSNRNIISIIYSISSTMYLIITKTFHMYSCMIKRISKIATLLLLPTQRCKCFLHLILFTSTSVDGVFHHFPFLRKWAV